MRSESRSRSPSEQMGERSSRGPMIEANPSNKIYVTFLPEDIDENRLKQVFMECGEVTRVYIKKKDDGFTFGYISYETVQEATKAVQQLNKRSVDDKTIRVQFARDNPNRSESRGDSRDSRQSKGDTRERGGADGQRGGGYGQSDTRRRFEGGRGGYEKGDRGDREERGGFRDGGDRNGGFRGGNERGALKCFKCQGEGHISRNCTGEDNNNKRDYNRGQNNGDRGEKRYNSDRNGGEFKSSKPKVDKMSEDEFSDY